MQDQGISPGRYRVVPRTLVFARHGDRLLLLQRAAASRAFPGRYNGLGGHVEAGEGLVASARRETWEEAGLHLGDLRLAGLLHVTDPTAAEGVLVTVFTAEVDDATVAASGEVRPRWVTLDEVSHLPIVPDLAQLLPRLWPRASAAPFVAVLSVREGSTLVFEDGGPGGEEGEPFTG